MCRLHPSINKIAPQRNALQGNLSTLQRDGQYEPRTFEPFVQVLFFASTEIAGSRGPQVHPLEW
jgi:hypothetical protein